MSIKHSGKSIKDQVRDFRAMSRDLPNYVGTEAVKFFKQGFIRQGYIDEGGLKRWKARSTKAKRNKGRKILVDTGALKRSIRITNKTANSVTVGTNLPYAQIHNEGGKINKSVQVKEHNRRIKKVFGKRLKELKTIRIKSFVRRMNLTIPQRQFIGRSRFFERRIQMLLEHKLKQALGIKL
jgi:phage gpG-like protein